MASPVLLFTSNLVANHLVAGIPAAARAVYTLVDNGHCASDDAVEIALPARQSLSPYCIAEFARLTPKLSVTIVPFEGVEPRFDTQIVDPFPLLERGELAQAEFTEALEDAGNIRNQVKRLNHVGVAILKATGKASDGLVSRYFNRPVSRAISRVLLKIEGVEPIHATGLAAFTGLLMAAALLCGSNAGLIAGALLFQAASVIDGVDGEMARATMRSSDFGARLDTVTDGITNLAFLCLASLNLWWQSEVQAALYGAIGLGILAMGLTALGLRSIAMGGPFTFDVVKNNFRARQSPIMTFLAAITSRDVYAAIFAVTFALGFAEPMLLIFAISVAIWFVTISTVLFRTRGQSGT